MEFSNRVVSPTNKKPPLPHYLTFINLIPPKKRPPPNNTCGLFFELTVISLHLRKKTDSTWNKWLNYSLKNDAEYDFATSKKKESKKHYITL